MGVNDGMCNHKDVDEQLEDETHHDAENGGNINGDAANNEFEDDADAVVGENV